MKFRKECVISSLIPADEVLAMWQEEEKSWDWKKLDENKGTPVYLPKVNGKNLEVVYYPSYKKDMAELRFYGTVETGFDNTEIKGIIGKPKSNLTTSIVLGIATLIVAFIFLIFTYEFTWSIITGTIGAIVIVMLQHVDRLKAQKMVDYISDFSRKGRKQK